MNTIKNLTLTLVLCISQFYSYGQTIDLTELPNTLIDGSMKKYHLKTNTLFESKQDIYILNLQIEDLKDYCLDVVYSDSTLTKTSIFGEKHMAIAAINGGFFEIGKDAASTNYLEIDGKVIDRGRPEKTPRIKAVMNAAIVIDTIGNVEFELAKPDSFYEASEKEKAVLGTGPMLLVNKKEIDMPDYHFVSNRHPRTCMCKTDNSILLIAIDGRSEEANGMSLWELQDFLKMLGCIDAINLDGRGSTAMWINSAGLKEVINNPTDSIGERSVANAIILKKRK